MINGKISEDIKGNTKVKDNAADRCHPQVREISMEEYLKIRPKGQMGRRLKFIFKDMEVKQMSDDIALFLVSKYPSVVIINEEQKEIAKDDALDLHNPHGGLKSMYAYLKKTYLKQSMLPTEFAQSNDKFKLLIRDIAIKVDKPVQELINEFNNRERD